MWGRSIPNPQDHSKVVNLLFVQHPIVFQTQKFEWIFQALFEIAINLSLKESYNDPLKIQVMITFIVRTYILRIRLS